MAKYLYIFGYRTPAQTASASEAAVISAAPNPQCRESNAKAVGSSAPSGHCEEPSEALFIETDSAEQALAWGREVSEAFLKTLYDDQAISWKALNFAHWIEPNPKLEYPAVTLSGLPLVPVGKLPDFKPWLPRPVHRSTARA
jgi:hypothetical protein